MQSGLPRFLPGTGRDTSGLRRVNLTRGPPIWILSDQDGIGVATAIGLQVRNRTARVWSTRRKAGRFLCLACCRWEASERRSPKMQADASHEPNGMIGVTGLGRDPGKIISILYTIIIKVYEGRENLYIPGKDRQHHSRSSGHKLAKPPRGRSPEAILAAPQKRDESYVAGPKLSPVAPLPLGGGSRGPDRLPLLAGPEPA